MGFNSGFKGLIRSTEDTESSPIDYGVKVLHALQST